MDVDRSLIVAGDFNEGVTERAVRFWMEKEVSWEHMVSFYYC